MAATAGASACNQANSRMSGVRCRYREWSMGKVRNLAGAATEYSMRTLNSTLSATMVPRLTQRMAKMLRGQPRRRWSVLIAAAVFGVASSTSCASQLLSQGIKPPAGWRFAAEAGGTTGGVWLEGVRAPRVSSNAGFQFAAALHRPVADALSAAASLRVSLQPLALRENGASWQGGTLTEYDLLAVLSFRAPGALSSNVSIEAGLGAAVLSSSKDIVPFGSGSTVAPLGELGTAIAIGDRASWGSDLAIVARYGIVRLTSRSDGADTMGWVGRASAGVRITR